MSKFLTSVRSFVASDDGAVMAEYVLLCVLIALVCFAVVASIGGQVRDIMFSKVPASLSGP